jgi:hypothetical protein
VKSFSKCLLEYCGREGTPVRCPRCRKLIGAGWSAGEIAGIYLNHPCRHCDFALGFWRDSVSAPHFRTVFRA